MYRLLALLPGSLSAREGRGRRSSSAFLGLIVTLGPLCARECEKSKVGRGDEGDDMSVALKGLAR